MLQLSIGDKGAYLYAAFGSPIAHENDAMRACASALELSRLGAETVATGVQIGVAAGRLRSGTYGHRERRTFCCLGDAVNVATRLMSAAGAGHVLVSKEVRRAAGDDFDWAAPVALALKGKAGSKPSSCVHGAAVAARHADTHRRR